MKPPRHKWSATLNAVSHCGKSIVSSLARVDVAICQWCSLYSTSVQGHNHWVFRDPYAMHRGSCLELYHCNMVEWSWWDSGLIWKTNWLPTGFLQCFDTVGLVIWPVKIVPDMTYNVFGGTLNLAQSVWVLTHPRLKENLKKISGI